jgi:CRP-like cAMP-binding protein
MDMIQNEFVSLHGSKRSVKLLDLILKNLKFFTRFDEAQRRMVFEQAEYMRVPARTVIFKQGDIGDKMYIILKGRVAVEKRTPECGMLPVVEALLKDGDHFGELGLID